LTPTQAKAALESLSEAELAAFALDWPVWARDTQLPPPGNWRTWMLQAGRGSGKTRAGAESIRYAVESCGYRHPILIGPTAADVRDVMIEGESGLIAISSPDCRPLYEPSKRKVTWPNGAVGLTRSADEPERMRGPQSDILWADELGSWRYADAWSLAMFGLRLGTDPVAIVTTTPKPIALVREILALKSTVVTRDSTYANRKNLAPAFVDEIIQRYEGTRLGRQEIYAELLDDNPDALWKRAWLDRDRVTSHPTLVRVVVGVDPAGGAVETGIIAAGLGDDGHGYVLADGTVRGTPEEWGRAVVSTFNLTRADRVIGETNYGGDMVGAVVRSVDRNVPFREVHASRGKAVRAEPISALYEQGRVHHCGAFARLEDELCEWVPGDKSAASPNRLDALVWALTDLMVKASHGPLRADQIKVG
jgi:phage terminase large subunit-like protein